jgi:hypothetical protein
MNMSSWFTQGWRATGQPCSPGCQSISTCSSSAGGNSARARWRRSMSRNANHRAAKDAASHALPGTRRERRGGNRCAPCAAPIVARVHLAWRAGLLKWKSVGGWWLEAATHAACLVHHSHNSNLQRKPPSPGTQLEANCWTQQSATVRPSQPYTIYRIKRNFNRYSIAEIVVTHRAAPGNQAINNFCHRALTLADFHHRFSRISSSIRGVV